MAEHGIVSMACARRIWEAHREIEVGTQLLADLATATASSDLLNKIQLEARAIGSHLMAVGPRLLDLSPDLATTVIKAHIENQRQKLRAACFDALTELMPPGAPP